MKYEIEAALSEVLQRQKQIIRRRERIRLHNLSLSAIAVCGALLTAIGDFGLIEQTVPIYSTYGAFLISPRMGGYILTGVLAFSAGVTITLLAKHHRKK